MEVLFSCLLAITLGILIIVSLLQYKQQSKSLQNDIENRPPFQSRHCLNFLSPSARCGRPPQRGCQLPQQQPQPTPLSPLHFTIVTFLRIVLLSNIVGYLLLSLQLFQGLFLHSLHYNNSIWSKRSILLPKDRQRLWTQESQTPHEGWWRRNKSEILQIFTQKMDF